MVTRVLPTSQVAETVDRRVGAGGMLRQLWAGLLASRRAKSQGRGDEAPSHFDVDEQKRLHAGREKAELWWLERS